MKFQVTFHDKAGIDMDEIEKYLYQFYPSTARNFFKKMKKQVIQLEDMPYVYPAYEKDPYFRRMVLGEYLLFYSVNESRNLVIVHRIFHHSRDIKSLQ